LAVLLSDFAHDPDHALCFQYSRSSMRFNVPSFMFLLSPDAKASDGSQPAMTFGFSLNETAGSYSLDHLVGIPSSSIKRSLALGNAYVSGDGHRVQARDAERTKPLTQLTTALIWPKRLS
jgi:hypothetical protein